MAQGTDSRSARRSVVSRWVGDPDIGGAYSYLRPGGTSADRDALAVEVLARVWLAGEYTWSAGPGTLHGAWFSGERAAAAVLERHELQRIAVIGSGMAGIGAAHLLHGSGREAEIFESSARPFGRAATDRSVGGPIHSPDTHVTLDFANRPSETFDAVICATPLPPIKTRRIVFDPPIPDAIATSMNRIGCGPIAKVVTTFDEPFWAPHRSFSLTGPEPQPLEFFVDVSTVVGQATLCGFAVGEHAAAVEAMAEDERCFLVDRLLTDAGVRNFSSQGSDNTDDPDSERPVRFP